MNLSDFMGPITNSSSLALKGGIGIRAMADLAEGVGRDGRKYRKAAKRYIQAWEKLATSKTDENGRKHLLLEYNKQDTWVLAYNLFADRCVCNLSVMSYAELHSGWLATIWFHARCTRCKTRDMLRKGENSVCHSTLGVRRRRQTGCFGQLLPRTIVPYQTC